MPSILNVRNAMFYFRLILGIFVLITLVILADYWLRGELGEAKEILDMAKEKWGRDVLIAGGTLYILLLSLPFVPGVELGLLLMCVFGREGIVFVYLATVVGLSLAFSVGRWLPEKWVAFWLEKLGLSDAPKGSNWIKEALERSALGQKLSQRGMGHYLSSSRYFALALLFNLPGNYLIGGGGGIALICGASRQFQWKWFLLTLFLATAPVPFLALFGVIQVEALLRS